MAEIIKKIGKPKIVLGVLFLFGAGAWTAFAVQRTIQRSRGVMGEPAPSGDAYYPPDVPYPGSGYIRRANFIFYGSGGFSLLTDIPTFQTLGENVAKDKDHVFIGNVMQEGIDPSSFRKSGKYWEDKNGYYSVTSGSKLQPLPFDPTTERDLSGGYMVASDGVYISYGGEFQKIDGADPATFHMIATCQAVEKDAGFYAADRNNVYVGTQIVPGADPSTFHMVGMYESPPGEMPMTDTYAMDKNTVYKNCGEVVKGADAATFVYLGGGNARDKNATYTLGVFGGN